MSVCQPPPIAVGPVVVLRYSNRAGHCTPLTAGDVKLDVDMCIYTVSDKGGFGVTAWL